MNKMALLAEWFKRTIPDNNKMLKEKFWRMVYGYQRWLLQSGPDIKLLTKTLQLQVGIGTLS